MMGNSVSRRMTPDRDQTELMDEWNKRRQSRGRYKYKKKIHQCDHHVYEWFLQRGDTMTEIKRTGTVTEIQQDNKRYEGLFYKDKTPRLYKWRRGEFIECTNKEGCIYE